MESRHRHGLVVFLPSQSICGMFIHGNVRSPIQCRYMPGTDRSSRSSVIRAMDIRCAVRGLMVKRQKQRNASSSPRCCRLRCDIIDRTLRNGKNNLQERRRIVGTQRNGVGELGGGGGPGLLRQANETLSPPPDRSFGPTSSFTEKGLR